MRIVYNFFFSINLAWYQQENRPQAISMNNMMCIYKLLLSDQVACIDSHMFGMIIAIATIDLSIIYCT